MKKPMMFALVIFYSTFSFAGTVTIRKPVVNKEPLKVDFHEMIVTTGEEKKQLHEDITAQDTAEAEVLKEEAYKKQKQEQKVIDFVDVEIGVGEAPAMVDRRAN